MSSGCTPCGSNLCCSYDMYKHIDERLAAKRGQPYTDNFVDGLPVGLKLPSGITIGDAHEDGMDGVGTGPSVGLA